MGSICPEEAGKSSAAAGQHSEMDFQLKDLKSGVQIGNTYTVAIDWGVSQGNQNGNKCSLTVYKDKNQKSTYLKGMYSYGGSFLHLSRKTCIFCSHFFSEVPIYQHMQQGE